MRQRNPIFVTSFLASLALHLIFLTVILYNPARRMILLALDSTDSEFGEQGPGDTLNYSPGEIPMTARHADANQVQLSRDPIGPGALGDLPSPSVVPMSLTETPSPPMQATSVEAPFGAQSASTDFAPPTPARKTSALRPADPAPDAGTETDAFSKVGDVDFRDGKAEARIGRNVKTVRPRFDLGAAWDSLAAKESSVVLAVNIDEFGKPTNVRFLKRIGSTSIDQPIEVAVYQWKFDPTVDASGKTIKDVLVFGIRFW